tara:strand:- start:186 stop:998 length:813 start_codon:yes stop_codon:yes gene_type:complete
MNDSVVYWYAAVNEDWTANGYCKMGITQNLVRRKSQYQTTSPKPHTLPAVIVIPASRRSEIDDKLKKCLASMDKNVTFQERNVGEEFYWYTDENEIRNLFKSFAVIDNEIQFLSGELFNERWERKDEQSSMPPPPITQRVRSLPSNLGSLIKESCVKYPEYYEKFIDLYKKPLSSLERYKPAFRDAVSGEGITFVTKARRIPIDESPSYGENDVLRGRPLDPSDRYSLLLWKREVDKIPRDDRAVNGNITTGNGSLSAIIGHFMKVYHAP